MKKKTQELIKRLDNHYGLKEWSRWREPVGELVRTILSQNTTDKNSLKAYADLQEAYPTWEDILVADEPDMADVIRSGGLANTKIRRDMALEVARKSIVLLKNENKALPLDKNKIKSIAVIGPNANEARLYGGGSGYLPAHYAISPLQGLRDKVGDDIDINFIKSGRLKRRSLPAINSSLLTPPNAKPGEQGLLGEYFNKMLCWVLK